MNLNEMIATRFKASTAKGDEFGFTNRYKEGSKRMVNKDGTFNVIRIGEKKLIFHELISMSWTKFVLFALSAYLIVNILFALLYMLIDFNGIGFTQDYQIQNHFFIAFYFSAQTLTTVGYGSLYPLSGTVSSLAALEALFGLMGFAIFTGLMYGRFSKPVHGIRFSKNILYSPYKDGNALMFRVANERNSNLIELEARGLVSIIMIENEKETRKYLPLEFDNNKVTYFPLNWTIVHPINEKSPLYGMSEEDFKFARAEFVMMIKGYNESFAQEIHAKSSYTTSEVQWNKRFTLPYHFGEDGITIFELDKIDEYENVRLN